MLKLEGKEINLAKSGDKYGIESLKEVAEGILEALEKFKKRAENGLNIWEKIRTGVDFGTLGGEIVGQLEEVKNEVLDLNELEMEELAKHIADKLDMEYNQAMQAISVIVIEFIDLAISAQKIYQNIRKLL